MLKLLRQSNLVRCGLFLLAASFVLCPHATHEPLSEVADALAHQVAPGHPVDAAPDATDHDHGHCDLDAAHSHDVRLTVSRILLPPPALKASRVWDAACLDVFNRQAVIHACSGQLPDGVLARLDVVRLLV